jgi:phosphoribosylformylglycinamidine cyclo-ligase
MARLLDEHFGKIKGLIHSSGGGQTKCMKYMPDGVHVIKDRLFPPPEIFRIIQDASGADNREMYQVFNMGCRMEIYTDEKNADEIISMAKEFGIDAKVIGRIESGSSKSLSIITGKETIHYS